MWIWTNSGRWWRTGEPVILQSMGSKRVGHDLATEQQNSASSVTHLCPTLCDPMDCSTPGFPIYHQLPGPAQTHVHWVGDAIQPSHPLSSPSPPAFNLSSIRVFSSELALCIRWTKYWGFSFSLSPFNEYSGLISFSVDWLDVLVIQGTLKNLLQHHSSKASSLWCSAFFMVQLSYAHMTTGETKTIDQFP